MKKVCEVADCERSVKGKGLCQKHYDQTPERLEHFRVKNRARKEKIKYNRYNDYNHRIHFPILLDKFNHECAYCGESESRLIPEHVISLSKNGANSMFNIVPSCEPCNRSKINHSFELWYPSQEIFTIERYTKIQSHRGIINIRDLKSGRVKNND